MFVERRVATRLESAIRCLGVTAWEQRAPGVAGASAAQLRSWAEEAETGYAGARQTALAARGAAWRTWVQGSLDRPAKLLRWVKQGTLDDPLAAKGADGRVLLDPGSVVEAAADAWNSVWNPPRASPGAPEDEGAPEAPLPPLSGELLAAVVRACPTGKAGGPDGWAIAELRALPRDYWDALATLLEVVEAVGAWPCGLHGGFVSLLPKPGATALEDYRPIVVLPVIYRIWAAARAPVAAAWGSCQGI